MSLYIIYVIYVIYIIYARLAEWIRRVTTNHEIAGSNPAEGVYFVFFIKAELLAG